MEKAMYKREVERLKKQGEKFLADNQELEQAIKEDKEQIGYLEMENQKLEKAKKNLNH